MNPDSDYFLKPSPEGAKCKTFEKGAFAKCLYIYFDINCPKPMDDDEECQKLNEYNKCRKEKNKK